MSFEELGLSAPILKAISDAGYTEPTPIQKKSIPVILEGRDVLASAQTGTGKTASFTLPLLELISTNPVQNRRNPRVLILTPTRELAAQVEKNIQTYSKYLKIKSAVIFGGVNQNSQVSQLKNGIDILVATPGRFLDLYNQKFIRLEQVQHLVLDEADRMLDMGFLRDIKKIIALLPSKRQSLLFSATFSDEIKKLAKSLLNNPVLIDVAVQNSTVDAINQEFYRIDKNQKSNFIIELLYNANGKQALVFTRTKHMANRLAQKLNKADISAVAIHGNKSQAARTSALDGFKKGKYRVLVATDIAARGLDIPLLPYVFNYEIPNVAEDYVHRIGRTGRAGETGNAISLVDVDEIPYIKSIEKLTDSKFDLKIETGFEPSTTERVEAVNRNNKNRNFYKAKKPQK